MHHEEANSKIQDVGNLIRTNDLAVWNKLPKEKEKEKRDVEFIDQKRLKRTINQMYCGHCLNPDSSKLHVRQMGKFAHWIIDDTKEL